MLRGDDSDHGVSVLSVLSAQRSSTDTFCRKIEVPEKAIMQHPVYLIEGGPDECESGTEY